MQNQYYVRLVDAFAKVLSYYLAVLVTALVNHTKKIEMRNTNPISIDKMHDNIEVFRYFAVNGLGISGIILKSILHGLMKS